MQVLDVYGLFDYVDGDDKTEYTSAEISDFLHPLMGDGVCAGDGGEFFATAEGLIVTLANGRAFLAGRGGKNTEAKAIELEPVSTGTSRIDRIAICVDAGEQKMGVEVVQGAQATSPIAPDLPVSDGMSYLPLWQALVADDSTVTLTDQRPMIKTPAQMQTHAHGNVTSAGAIGTAAGRVVCTGEGGALEAADAATAAALLGVNGKAPLVHAARHASGGADALTPAAIGAAASGHTHTPAAIGAVAASEKGAAGGVATLDAGGKVTAAQAASDVVQVTAGARTLSLADAGKFLYLRNGSAEAQAYTITVPAQGDVAFPTGTEIELFRYTSGSVTIQAASGVYLMRAGGTVAAGNSVQIGQRFGVVALKKFSASLWLVAGDVA